VILSKIFAVTCRRKISYDSNIIKKKGYKEEEIL